MGRVKNILIVCGIVIGVFMFVFMVKNKQDGGMEQEIGPTGQTLETEELNTREAKNIRKDIKDWEAEQEENHEDIETLAEPEIPEEILGGEGDPGEDEEPVMLDDILSVPLERATKAGFQEFMLEYAFTQNYTQEGFDFGYADKVYENGITLEDSAARISGMGNAGYIIWAIRNTFGYCDPDFVTPLAVYSKSPKVLLQELQIGDLGFYSEAEEENFCGICIGFEDGEPVFSLMDGSWSEKFPFGTNRLCYLKDGKNEFIGYSQPVKFQFFCRPALPWQLGAEGTDLKGRIKNGSDKQNY